MNNIVDNFGQILEFAKNYGLPVAKKRAILREYLQSKIIDGIYQEPKSKDIYFIGGTSLRLLRGLDRFSEDLDFDISDILLKDIASLMERQHKKLRAENINVSWYKNITAKRTYFEFRFENLLSELSISNNKDEKLAIKFDFEALGKQPKKEIVLLNRYGFLVNIVTIPIDQMLTQKLLAYLKRKETQARDIYDIVWLVSQGAKSLDKDLLILAVNKYRAEKHKISGYKAKLRPFLINEDYVAKLDLFDKVILTNPN